MAKWIDVKKRLPELDKPVLCLVETINHPCAGNKRIEQGYRLKMCNCNTEKFSSENSYNLVTHWRNLPKLPVTNTPKER